jgi:hypothetical protein
MTPPASKSRRFDWDTVEVSDFVDPKFANARGGRGKPSSGRLPRPQAGELYLGGPIPLAWLSRAAALPGRAFHLAIALWFDALASRAKSATVRLPMKTRRRFGLVCQKTYYRAVGSLKRAGLINDKRRRGKVPVFTILPLPRKRSHAR